MNRASFLRARISGVVFVSALSVGSVHLAGQSPQPASMMPAAANNVPAQNAQPGLAQRYPRYIVQRQDVIALSFPLSTEMNQTVTVQPDGYINLQNGRSLHAQGMTVPELTDAVNFRKYVPYSLSAGTYLSNGTF